MLQESSRRVQLYYATSIDSMQSDPNFNSLLSTMLRLTLSPDRESGLTIDEVVSNAISFVGAGWETATLTLTNSLWPLLAVNNFSNALYHQLQLAKEGSREVFENNGLESTLADSIVSGRLASALLSLHNAV